MLKKLIPAVLGLIVCVQSSSSFAGGSFFSHHHHGHHHHHHFNHGQFFIQPFPFAQQQYVLVKKWTPYGWVYVKQPVGLVRF